MEKFRDFAIKYLTIAEKDLKRAKRILDDEDYTSVKYYSSGMFVRLGLAVAVHCELEILPIRRGDK